MKIMVNGEERILAETCNLAEALQHWGYKSDMPIAVAMNNTFIPKQDYVKLILTDGNKLEILMPMQGG